MSRILKRPMFRRGGSSNQGIMTGLVDRKGYQEDGFVTTVGQRAAALTPELEALLRQYTPKTRLPIGEFGLNIASGKSITEALQDPYRRFIRADDAREAAIRGGAAKLAIGKALEKTKDTRHPLEKLAVSMGLKVGSPEYNRFIRAATAKTEAAASGLQRQGQVVGGSQRDEIVRNTSFVSQVRENLDEVSEMMVGDPTLGGFTGTLRRIGNKIATGAKDFGFDVSPFITEGMEEKVCDTEIAKLAAIEDLIAPAYARVVFPNQRMTTFLVKEAKDKMNLTGATGSEEVQTRLKEIKRQFDMYLKNNAELLGNQPVLKKDLDEYFFDTKSRKLKLRGQQ